MKFRIALLILFALVIAVACSTATPIESPDSTVPLVATESPDEEIPEEESTPVEAEASLSFDEQLIEAVNDNHVDAVAQLLTDGADANVVEGDDFFSNPILRTAIMNEYTEVVALLLSHGADANAQDSKGNGMLLRAIEGKYVEVAQLLIDAGADVNAVMESDDALLPIAVRVGSAEIVSQLLDAGASLDGTLFVSFQPLATTGAVTAHATPLGVATLDGSINMMQLLLDAGADVNQNIDNAGENWQAITYAAIRNNTDAIQLLADHGANVNGMTPEGSPLGYASGMMGFPEATAKLIELGADVNAITGKSQGHMPILHVAQALDETRDNSAVIQLLLDAGAVSSVDESAVAEATTDDDGDEEAQLATAKAGAQLSNQWGRAIVSARGNHFVVDSVPPLEGPNEELNPLDMLLGALATCGVFIAESASLELDYPLTNVVAFVEGDFDPSGVAGSGSDPRIQMMRVHLEMDGLDAEQSAEIIDHFKRRCPVYTTLSRATDIEITTGDETASEPIEGLATAKASAQLSNQPGRAIVSARGNHFVIDSVPPIDGPNEERNPLDLLLGALATCASFVVERVAVDESYELGQLVTFVEADFDPRGVAGHDVNPRLQEFRIVMQVEGLSAEEIAFAVEQYQQRCPIYTTLVRAAPIALDTQLIE